MVVTQWWMLIVWLVAIPVAVVLARLLYKKANKRAGRAKRVSKVAHVTVLEQLPQYKKVLKQYRVALWGMVAVLGIVFLCQVIISLRPSTVTISDAIEKNRDVMLCLDVSGSMKPSIEKLMKAYQTVANNLDGQRIGLSVFNTISSQAIPLTRDKESVQTGLSQALKATSAMGNIMGASDDVLAAYSELFSPTYARSDELGTSLTTDGIVGCAQALGENKTNRAQSIILATDNDMAGTPIFTMKQAMSEVQRRGIRVYVVYPEGEAEMGLPAQTLEETKGELRALAAQTGGRFYELQNLPASDIVARIKAEEAVAAPAAKELAQKDTPGVFILVSAIMLIILYAAWWRYRV